MPARLRPTAPIAADAVLVGDPGRALLLAQALVEEPKMSNHARGLWGYSGRTPDGAELTIQSTGMGGPSAAIVLTDLAELGVRRAIRIGTCAALDPSLGARRGADRHRGARRRRSRRLLRNRAGEARRPDPELTAGLERALAPRSRPAGDRQLRPDADRARGPPAGRSPRTCRRPPSWPAALPGDCRRGGPDRRRNGRRRRRSPTTTWRRRRSGPEAPPPAYSQAKVEG